SVTIERAFMHEVVVDPFESCNGGFAAANVAPPLGHPPAQDVVVVFEPHAIREIDSSKLIHAVPVKLGDAQFGIDTTDHATPPVVNQMLPAARDWTVRIERAIGCRFAERGYDAI